MSFIQNTKASSDCDFESAAHIGNLRNCGDDRCEYAFSAASRTLSDC